MRRRNRVRTYCSAVDTERVPCEVEEPPDRGPESGVYHDAPVNCAASCDNPSHVRRACSSHTAHQMGPLAPSETGMEAGRPVEVWLAGREDGALRRSMTHTPSSKTGLLSSQLRHRL